MKSSFSLTASLRSLIFLAVSGVLTFTGGAAVDRILPPPSPENLISNAHEIDPAHLVAPWDNLIADLQKKGDILARFTENRFLPFKKIPVVFTGEIRLSHEHGLSLHYVTPDNRLMIVDTKGVLMRDGAGRTRELPADPHALAATSALLHVMRFDLSSLTEHFELYAAKDQNFWHFGFEPKDDAVAKSLNRLIVTGENNEVRRILMRKSALQSVEIIINDERSQVSFTPEEIQRFFR